MTTTGAEDIRWDLTDLYSNTDTLHEDLAVADQEADAFAEAYRGKMASMEAGELAEALRRYEDLQDRMITGSPCIVPRLEKVPVRVPLPPAPDNTSIFKTQKSAGAKSAFYKDDAA